jgi:hypothetical protein
MWRKTRRDNGDGSYGVDPNRNYDYFWGYDDVGSSPFPEDATYRGPYAFSEPCVIAIRDFCIENEFQIALNYHSFSNLLLYPWGYTEDPCPDDDIFFAHASLMTQENGYTYGAGSSTIYPTNGGSDDWMYGEQETKDLIFSYTPEVGNSNDGFWPDIDRIIPLCQENMLQNILAAKLSGAWATVEDISPSIIEETSGQFYFGVERLGFDDDGVYTVSITPVNDAIAEIGDPMEFDNLDMLEYQGGSISFELKEDITPGEEIIFLLSIDNGMIINSDTIVKVYGTPVVIFEDDAESFEKWSSPKWDITQAQSHSPSNSIADSPYGDYNNFENNSIVMIEPVDLTTAAYAVLNYWAKWEIESGYDYVQIYIKGSAGGPWTPMEGKYTKMGNSNQAEGEPVYDGFQTEWVKEEISLADYIGQSIQVRFTLRSDTYVTEDGFFWDDMTVSVIDDFTSINETAVPDNIGFNLFPNPVNDRLNIEYHLGREAGDLALEVFDATGRLVHKTSLEGGQGQAVIDVASWSPGIYSCNLTLDGKHVAARKIVK